MKAKLVITADWILENYTDRVIFHESKKVIITAKIFNKFYCWVELALKSMNIEYVQHELEFDKEFHYIFDLDDIKELAPEFYKRGKRGLMGI